MNKHITFIHKNSRWFSKHAKKACFDDDVDSNKISMPHISTLLSLPVVRLNRPRQTHWWHWFNWQDATTSHWEIDLRVLVTRSRPQWHRLREPWWFSMVKKWSSCYYDIGKSWLARPNPLESRLKWCRNAHAVYHATYRSKIRMIDAPMGNDSHKTNDTTVFSVIDLVYL